MFGVSVGSRSHLVLARAETDDAGGRGGRAELMFSGEAGAGVR